MEIVYVYQKKRRQFGRQSLLQERSATLNIDIQSDPTQMANYSVRNPSHTEVQCAPDMSEHEANTESFVVMNRGVLHKEGGWPKDVDPTDVEHTLRYKKKVEKDEEYMKIVKNLCESVEVLIKQNNAIDIYEEYFQGKAATAEEPTIETPSAKTVNVYRDPCEQKRSISNICWMPENGHKVAVAYSSLDFQRSNPTTSYESFIWDIENPNAPDFKLISSSPLVCLKYNPKDSHILIGGCYNGLVGFWDTRKGPYPVDMSAVEKSHRDPVFNVSWVSSKTGSEFFSTSTDGQVLWWDIRKMAEPTDSMVLDPEKNGSIVGGTVLDFESTMPTKFMVGGENGAVFMCNKKAKNPSERISHVFTGHHGPICALQRNPFFPKNFITVGDWSAKIWFDEIKSPIMTTKYETTYLTDGVWSPTRPSVFVTAKMDGSVDVWDFMFKQNSPTLTVQVSSAPIQSVKFQESGRLLAVGARDGTTTLVELSESLAKLQPNEKAVFSAMLEREAKREKTLETLAREKRLKAQQKPPRKVIQESVDEILKNAEKEFAAAIETEKVEK